MGKGTIISGGEAGRYTVRLNYANGYLTNKIAQIDDQIDFYYDQIATLTDENAIARRKLWISALRKQKYIYENAPGDENVSAWCADLTDDLSGEVGTVEIESVNGTVLIRPGYEGNAVFQPLRDGQLQSLLAGDPSATLLNFMFHDGRQKWFPRHRSATLTSVDHEADTCGLTLDTASGAMTGTNINIDSAFAGVPVEYMNCNSAPFEVGDRVVVEFEGNDWDSPKVIGFLTNPKACDHDYVIITSNARPWDPDAPEIFEPDQWSIVWDVGMNCMAGEIPASATPGDYLEFPCPTDDLAYWASITDEREASASVTWDTYSNLEGEDWAEVEAGVYFYPAGGEGVMCNPAFWNTRIIEDYHYKEWTQDKFKWESETNVEAATCSQRKIVMTYRNTHPKIVGKIWPGYATWPIFYIETNSPLGQFESFVNDCQVYGCVFHDPIPPPDYENSWYYWLYPIPHYQWPWWATSTWDSLTPHAVYSKNSHVQIYIHSNRFERQYRTGGDDDPDTWVYDVRKATKIQLHAAASYHPDEDGFGGINANPLMLSRNSDFENAILDLVKTQLQEEDASHGEDWSFWALDEDHDPSWPGPGDSTLFDEAATETYQIPLLYSLSFDIQFREYPEEE